MGQILNRAVTYIHASSLHTNVKLNSSCTKLSTHAKCHVNYACHRLSISINTAWEAETEESDKLAILDTTSNNLVKFVKKSGGIQYITCYFVKWWKNSTMVNKFSSILISYEALRPLLREKILLVVLKILYRKN